MRLLGPRRKVLWCGYRRRERYPVGRMVPSLRSGLLWSGFPVRAPITPRTPLVFHLVHPQRDLLRLIAGHTRDLSQVCYLLPQAHHH